MRVFLLVAGLALAFTRTVSAQPMPPEIRAAMVGDRAVRLVSTFERHGGTQLRIGSAKPISLHQGESVGALVAGHGKLVVALATRAKEPFSVAIVEGGKVSAPLAIARPGTRRDLPFAVVGTPTAKGFTLFFQEIQQDDPSAAHTYMLALDAAGKPVGAATEIAVPWALAAAIDNGAGYHLGLIYAADGMRLSMVSLSVAGAPQQHPDWASPRGFISQVHLVSAGKQIRAIYRGGAGGNRILETDVTSIRSWGAEPAKPKDLGTVGAGQVLAVVDGKPVKVQAR